MTKNTSRKLLTSALLAAGLLGASISYANDMTSNVTNNPCAGCHGTNGVSLGQAPHLAGLPAAYLVSTMKAYANKTRFSTIMGRIARGYSDEQLQNMGDFFASKDWPQTEHKVDPKLVAKGQLLHLNNGCTGCHGVNGKSSSPTIPNLAGQFPEYLRIQMEDYRSGNTPIPPAAMIMRNMTGSMSDDEIASLAAYYAAQK